MCTDTLRRTRATHLARDVRGIWRPIIVLNPDDYIAGIWNIQFVRCGSVSTKHHSEIIPFSYWTVDTLRNPSEDELSD